MISSIVLVFVLLSKSLTLGSVFLSPHLDFPNWEVMFSSVKSLGEDLAFLKTLYTLVCMVAKGRIFGDQSVSCSTFKKNKSFLPCLITWFFSALFDYMLFSSFGGNYIF